MVSMERIILPGLPAAFFYAHPLPWKEQGDGAAGRSPGSPARGAGSRCRGIITMAGYPGPHLNPGTGELPGQRTGR
ncbi:hypothetical protein ASZ90_014983 [hydrocarbon metagenome]|uniref:Uncharacterized protein n=1 Tax=hydrocarbon metagenome TaxID=938273 RepID=A0A0W8F382_9ZZZZ